MYSYGTVEIKFHSFLTPAPLYRRLWEPKNLFGHGRWRGSVATVEISVFILPP